jgi:eukaryotic-like serine/threonine-protein kinase
MHRFARATRAIPILTLALMLIGFFQTQQTQAASHVLRPLNHSHAHIMKVQHSSTTHTRTTPSDLLTYNGGPIMQTNVNYAIFWEPATLQDSSSTHVSATYNSLISRYFNDIGGSGLYGNNTQYHDTGNHILNNSTLGGTWIDTSTYPASTCSDSATPSNCLVDTDIETEVQRAMTVKGWTGGINHMFYVFTSFGEGSCFDTGSSSCAFTEYCGYHSFFSDSNNHPVIYANMPYTGTSLNGCGISTSPNHDTDADSTISVTSHEQMEAVTDPELNAWYDKQGYEIGDKCAWNFGNVNKDNNTANVQFNNNFYIVQQEWSNAIDGCTLTGPSTQSNGTLYIGSNDGYLYALNVTDGSRLWRAKTGGAVLSTPAVANNIVYISSNDGYVYAFNTTNGSQVWRYGNRGLILSSPVVANGIVYLGASDGNLYTLDATKGTVLGRFAVKSPLATTPAVVNGTVYIGATNGYFYAINGQHQNWRYQVSGATFSTAIVTNNIVYFGASNGYLYALNATKGTLLWRYATSRPIVATPTVVNNTVYIGSSNGYLYALNATTGTLTWKFQTKAQIVSQASITNNTVFFGSFDHNLYAVDATTGLPSWKFSTGNSIASSPAVVNGAIYFGSNDHYIYSLATANSSQNWRYTTGNAVQSSPIVVLPS